MLAGLTAAGRKGEITGVYGFMGSGQIELARALCSATGARAIAGSINIVLREELVKRENDVRPGLGWEEGRWQPGISVLRSDTLDKFNYNVGANVLHRDLPRNLATTTTAVDTRTGAYIERVTS